MKLTEKFNQNQKKLRLGEELRKCINCPNEFIIKRKSKLRKYCETCKNSPSVRNERCIRAGKYLIDKLGCKSVVGVYSVAKGYGITVKRKNLYFGRSKSNINNETLIENLEYMINDLKKDVNRLKARGLESE